MPQELPRRLAIIDLTRNVLLLTDPERLIGYGRIVTVGFAILAIYLDPTQPAEYQTQARTSLAIYAVAAIALMLFPLRLPVDHPLHFAVHLVDVIVLGWIAFLTNELRSPFFSFLPFTLLAMTIRWGLMGALAGAIVLELMLLTIGIPDVLDGESELNFIVIRSAYFLVFATMLGYFGAYRERSRARLTRLADWPLESMASNRRHWLDSVCGHAAEVVGCRELFLISRDQERAQGFVAAWSRGDLAIVDVDDPRYWSKLNRNLLASVPDAGAREIGEGDRGMLSDALQTLVSRPLPRLTIGVAAGFATVGHRGVVIIVDPDCRPEDALSLGAIIAGRIGAELEHVALMAQIADSVRVEERARLARDLHDSVLQDLTATSLKLRAASIQAPTVSGELHEIEKLVTEQQRRIRRFVENPSESRDPVPVEAAAELHKQARLLGGKWGIAVTASWDGADVRLPSSAMAEIVQLASEATANAVRHGQANCVALHGEKVGSKVVLRVRDDGIGLNRRAAPAGSLSLRSRIAGLGGSMALADAAPGLEVTMTFPLELHAA